MEDIKLQSEKKELKAGDILGYLYGGKGEPVPMLLIQENIDAIKKIHKENNLDEIDDRLIGSASPKQMEEIRELHESWRIESKLKEIVPHWDVYSKTAQSDMTLCYQKGLEQKEQYAKEHQQELLKTIRIMLLHHINNYDEDGFSNAELIENTLLNELIDELTLLETELQVKQ